MSIVARIESNGSSVNLHDSGNATINFHFRGDNSEVSVNNHGKKDDLDFFSTLNIENGKGSGLYVYINNEDDFKQILDALIQSQFMSEDFIEDLKSKI